MSSVYEYFQGYCNSRISEGNEDSGLLKFSVDIFCNCSLAVEFTSFLQVREEPKNTEIHSGSELHSSDYV